MTELPVLHIEVRGDPVPQGSKAPGGIREANPRHKAWRDLVTLRSRQEAAQAHWARIPLGVSVHLILTFRHRRPKAHFDGYGLRENAPTWHTNTPDASKLLRSVEDSISDTQTIWGDDRQVCHADVWDRYVAPGEEPGVSITIRELTEDLQRP